MSYTTLARVQAELKGTNANLTAGVEQLLMGYVRTVTNRIRAYRFEFEPLYMTKKITPTRQTVNSVTQILQLKDYLLEVDSITIGGVAMSYGTDVTSEPDDGQTPIRALRIVDPRTAPAPSWYGCCVSTYINSIIITGFWGMREYYTSQGFFTSTQTSPILNATQTSFTVTNVDGTDAYNRTPEFSAGNLIRIEDELMDVVDTDITTNALTVIRGVRGTTGAGHAAGTAIKIWEPEFDVANMATRQAGLLYARRGGYQQVVSYPDGINVSYPSDLLAEIRATVQRFNYL